MGIFLLLTPIYQCRLRGGKQRKGQECGAQRLSGKYEDKRKNWLWIRESIINVDRKEPQYWYLTPGKKASKVQKEHSQGRGWTFFIKLNQLPDCSYNTNGLLVRLYSSDLLRLYCVCSRTTVSQLFERRSVLRVGADQSTTALAFLFELCIYLTLFKTIYTLTHCYNIKCCFHS